MGLLTFRGGAGRFGRAALRVGPITPETPPAPGRKRDSLGTLGTWGTYSKRRRQPGGASVETGNVSAQGVSRSVADSVKNSGG